MNANIRRALPEDAAEIANVHINSWREAYHNLLPQKFLDELPLAFKKRMQMWRVASENKDKSLFVAEADCGIVGFSIFEAARESAMAGYGEVSAIYLLEKFKHQKIGLALLKIGMNELFNKGYSQAYCWVLENNPTISFYERSGAKFNGMEKPAEIGGKRVNELAYVWSDLNHFRKAALRTRT